jgi:CDP-paratose 2-epimerase
VRILITGGAGFIGCNTADAFLADGHHVAVLDNLSRPGSELNLSWLRDRHPGLEFHQVDVQDTHAVAAALRAVASVDAVVHLAGQVAVTTSIADPRSDFQVNALGTLNVLEAVRAWARDAVVIYASTNKVYGNLEHLAVRQRDRRYEFADRPQGISEAEPLDFHSPYGCSKGAADQYVRDYARIYGMRTVVMRQSCIYGRRQFGMEDQGWVAWFVLAALAARPITIYGDGRQVRDVLFIDDLVRAYRAALRTPAAWGEVFNIGGGPRRTLSVWTEFGPLLERMLGREIPVTFADWRPGDQRVFVSDVRKAERLLGWSPTTSVEAGIAALCDWAAELAQDAPRPVPDPAAP